MILNAWKYNIYIDIMYFAKTNDYMEGYRAMERNVNTNGHISS